MSQDYLVLILDCEEDAYSIDGAKGDVFMRFTQKPPSEFLQKLAAERLGKRVYCLLGASTWHSVKPPCSHDYQFTGLGGLSNQLYECLKCGDTYERDVS